MFLTTTANVSDNTSRPYPQAKEIVSNFFYCELCDRTIPTKDQSIHNRSKKHNKYAAEKRARDDANRNGNSNDNNAWGDESTGFGNSNDNSNGYANGNPSGNAGGRGCYTCGGE